MTAAIETLRVEGFAGASARVIARRAGCNQGLVFYHFGSVGNLLLAALDEVSARRMARYVALVEEARGLPGLLDAAELVFREDLEAGHISVLAEMMAGASSTPGLGSEVAARMAPRRTFAADAFRRALAGAGLPEMVPAQDAADGVVALYLGLEMLAHLDGDRSRAERLFARVREVTGLLAGFLPALIGTPPAPSTPGDGSGAPDGPTSRGNQEGADPARPVERTRRDTEGRSSGASRDE